jgi:hypothetical protein
MVLRGGAMRARHLLFSFLLLSACAGDDPDAGGAGGGGGKADDPAVSPELVARATENLARVEREVDRTHLASYGLAGATAEQFVEALQIEYADEPDQLLARVQSLASMIFFAAPDIAPPEGGKATPFHGLDMDQFATLMDIEDRIWDDLVDRNGGSVTGVRPFSVCETRYMIETFVRPRQELGTIEDYRAGYATFAATCARADVDEWYNFRGLGHLRPSWVESNIQDRFLRRMAKECDGTPSADLAAECEEWDDGRLAYRMDGNRQMAARFMHYAPEQEELLADTSTDVALFEDRDHDGIAEFAVSGPAELKNGGGPIDLEIRSTGEFTGILKGSRDGGAEFSVKPKDLFVTGTAHPSITRDLIEQDDMGLQTVFSDPTGCTGEAPSPGDCPLLKRFFVLIDRHEDFYQTYTSLRPDSSSISAQPSPLVACSITLAAAHAWDTAGIPSGGEAGFIFLMRIPFEQILAGSETSVATLEPGPDVLSIADLYAGASLDMSKVWLDIATLSNNLFESEHEISKFGAVPAEQIEGILVIRRPAAMGDE